MHRGLTNAPAQKQPDTKESALHDSTQAKPKASFSRMLKRVVKVNGQEER